MKKMVVAIALAVSLSGLASPAQASVPVGQMPASLAGQFCKKTEVGQVKTADNGAQIKCVVDGSRHRWIVK